MSIEPGVVEGRPGLPLGMPAAHFLTDYWQRRPLLVRQALARFRAPLTGDDLAALALREQVLARLILHDRRRRRWQLEYGPLAEDRFDRVPARDWTLLVQDVDKWDPDVAALLAHFDFLPRWRIDDIMVSFAAPGGSVGAHVDQYDVFLLQGEGHRRWAIDARPHPDLSLQAGAPLKLLQHFNPSHEWLLEPGDMLYLPPGVPHHGVAEDACLTLSVGMRAPALKELLLAYVAETVEQLDEAERYRDPPLTPATDPALLDASALQGLRAALGDGLQRLAAGIGMADDFLGRYLSSYRAAREPQPRTRGMSEEVLLQRLQRGRRLYPDRWLRWLYRDGHEAVLHVAGHSHALPTGVASQLARGAALDLSAWQAADAATRQTLLQLLGSGALQLR